MALYELRTYTLRVGAMAEAGKLYQEVCFPALQNGGQDKKLVGYFRTDTGTMDFVEGFASKFRPLLMTQEVRLLQAAPSGPHP